jgi:hypothetical protein
MRDVGSGSALDSRPLPRMRSMKSAPNAARPATMSGMVTMAEMATMRGMFPT